MVIAGSQKCPKCAQFVALEGLGRAQPFLLTSDPYAFGVEVNVSHSQICQLRYLKGVSKR